MINKIQDETFNLLLKTFPLPLNLENFSIRNKTILLKCLTTHLSLEQISNHCLIIQNNMYTEIEGKRFFNKCYKNICDLLFEYANEYYSTLDKISYSNEFGTTFKLMEHTVFDSKYQDILRTVWLNFIKMTLMSCKDGFGIYPSQILKEAINKHIDGYYDYKKLELYIPSRDSSNPIWENLSNTLKEKIAKQFDIWDHKIEENYLIKIEDESLLAA